jgi:hypothetical protein
MVMPPWDTFDYVATVPENYNDAALQWTARLRHPITSGGDKLARRKLVGHAPRLQISDGGLTPNPCPHRPSVMRSRVTLAASTEEDATISSISFYVDRDLIRQLRPGDEVHISRTACACLGLSINRMGDLVAAIGDVSAVDLGRNFKPLSTYHLIQEASQIFKKVDPAFSFPEHPIEFVHKTQRRILFHGDCRVGEYEVLLRHGFLAGIPGTDESAAICKAEHQVPAFVSASAHLLETEPIDLVDWPAK